MRHFRGFDSPRLHFYSLGSVRHRRALTLHVARRSARRGRPLELWTTPCRPLCHLLHHGREGQDRILHVLRQLAPGLDHGRKATSNPVIAPAVARLHYCLPRAVLTMARMPARIASGRLGHTSTTAANSGESLVASGVDPCSSSASLVQTGVQTRAEPSESPLFSAISLGERLHGMQEVVGSIPIGSTFQVTVQESGRLSRQVVGAGLIGFAVLRPTTRNDEWENSPHCGGQCGLLCVLGEPSMVTRGS